MKIPPVTAPIATPVTSSLPDIIGSPKATLLPTLKNIEEYAAPTPPLMAPAANPPAPPAAPPAAANAIPPVAAPIAPAAAPIPKAFKPSMSILKP
ncbi:hypothetical protein D3C84_1006870 [compost metagenome]